MMIHMLQVLAVQAARRCFLEKSSVNLSSRNVLSFVGFADVLSGKLMQPNRDTIGNNRSSYYNNSDDYRIIYNAIITIITIIAIIITIIPAVIPMVVRGKPRSLKRP